MNDAIKEDLRSIFRDNLAPDLLERFITLLESIEVENEDPRQRLWVRTRKPDDRPPLDISKRNPTYFTFVRGLQRPKPRAIFGGGIERRPDSTRPPAAAVNVRYSNPFVRTVENINRDLVFPFQKDNRNPRRMCVVISEDTVGILRDLLQSEVLSFLSR
jgi:hypothetical protein